MFIISILGKSLERAEIGEKGKTWKKSEQTNLKSKFQTASTVWRAAL
jgi:hypothetical protein